MYSLSSLGVVYFPTKSPRTGSSAAAVSKVITIQRVNYTIIVKLILPVGKTVFFLFIIDVNNLGSKSLRNFNFSGSCVSVAENNNRCVLCGYLSSIFILQNVGPVYAKHK